MLLRAALPCPKLYTQSNASDGNSSASAIENGARSRVDAALWRKELRLPSRPSGAQLIAQLTIRVLATGHYLAQFFISAPFGGGELELHGVSCAEIRTATSLIAFSPHAISIL